MAPGFARRYSYEYDSCQCQAFMGDCVNKLLQTQGETLRFSFPNLTGLYRNIEKHMYTGMTSSTRRSIRRPRRPGDHHAGRVAI